MPSKMGSGLLLDEFVALGGAQAQGVAAALEGEEELGAVVVFPCAGVDGAAAQADDDGHVLDADRALELAGAAGGALEDGFLGVVLAGVVSPSSGSVGCGAEVVEIGAQRRG